MFGRSRNYFQEIKHMKELKADDPTDERADILNTAADQQPSFRESAIRPSSSDPSRQLRRLPRRQYQFGPPLADGYAPESATPVQKPMPQRERQTPGSSLGRSPSRNSPGDKKIVKLSAAVRQEIERELAYVRAAWQSIGQPIAVTRSIFTSKASFHLLLDGNASTAHSRILGRLFA